MDGGTGTGHGDTNWNFGEHLLFRNRWYVQEDLVKGLIVKCCTIVMNEKKRHANIESFFCTLIFP